jgi:tetratricopeptide (TPR) repeat protein
MLDFDNPLGFDLFQQLVEWINISMLDYRKGRHFLENNALLMQHGSDKELGRLIVAQVEERLEMKRQMQYLQALLHNARQRGGTAQAIREAYVNTYGGLVLDLPAWLREAEEARSFLVRLRRPERTTRRNALLLQVSIERARYDKEVAPEVIAELQNELGYTLLQGPHPRSQREYMRILKQAINCHEAALHTYTFKQYPFQYARTHMQLGLACQYYGVASGQKEWLERAIAHFKDALRVYDRQNFPEQWAMLHTHMGCTYLHCGQDTICDTLEYAITCHRRAVDAVQQETFPTVWATAQINLGDAYRQRMVGDHANNLKDAIQCYLNALQVFMQKDFPREWATINTRLAFLFQHARAEEIDVSENMNLRCSIVCYEAALAIYSPDAFPVECAATQVSLGNVHRLRTDTGQRENLEQAHKYYLDALQVFTEQAFPREHQQILYNLKETEQLLGELNI